MADSIDRLEKSDAAKREEETLAFWQEHQIFEKSLEKASPKGEYTFYDGPPFATGLPHAGSLLSSVSKDLIPRYKTMRGYRVRRRWGWDTHGLPIETLVEKRLGLKNKKEIVQIGIEKFNETAREMVLEYVHDWKRYVERVGRFVDFDNSYKTMDPTFMESVWWGIKQIHDKGHLYEGRKVLMYCPHCETPLAKAEIAMDNTYKDITEEAATVKFKVKDPAKNGLPENTFILAWTTTPWTLPGNVALAVKNDIQYGIYKAGNENLIVAKALAEKNGLTDLVSELLGAKLVGAQYEPLYEVAKVAAYTGKKWEVVPADFVTTEDGTGVVHTAVIYGEDDYNLGVKESLPMIPILNPNATYNDDAPEWLRGKYIKKAEADIKADLETRTLLFAKAPHTHSYPHCYRCGTALIYNAVSSWFINIQAVKAKLIKENEKITWAPEHLKHGRFQHILETAPDWTISRNRFWASPLPIWKDTAGNVTVIGSLEELKAHTKKSGNKYFVMRHGEAEHNLQGIASSGSTDNSGLTETGKEQVRNRAKKLKSTPITHIYTSPMRRARETAEIMADVLGISHDRIISDETLREVNFGDLDGKPISDFFTYKAEHMSKYSDPLPNGESFLDAKRRFGAFLYNLEEVHQDSIILMVSHGCAFETLKAVVEGADEAASLHFRDSVNSEPAELMQLDFIPLPHNRNYELDYHLPYIDEVQLVNKKGEPLTRIPEVVDCWVESGSMPFAEYHYPFANKKEFEKHTPGDFVSEYIGQTRAWFYYMHAMSVELFGQASFKNVLTTGTILAADGEKLSKSKQNYTDPYVLFDRFSADAFRYYIMSSVVMQAEDLIFRDDEVKEIQNRVVNMLRNVLAFYSLYKDELSGKAAKSGNVLDRWILTRLAEVTTTATNNFDSYDVTSAVRPMREFIDDLSTWYVRFARDRVKSTDETEKQYVLHTLRQVLLEFSKVIAPVMPFVAEEVFQVVREADDVESVHLSEWPKAGSVDTKLISEMTNVRGLVSEALKLRQEASVIVRQPLAHLSVSEKLSPEMEELVKKEVNVKEVLTSTAKMTGTARVVLNTELTPELIREGDVRKFMRSLAEARKEKGLMQRDTVSLAVEESGRALLENETLSGVSGVTFETISDGFKAELSSGPVSFSFTTDAA